MNNRNRLLQSLLCVLLCGSTTLGDVANGPNGAIATVNPIASAAGADVLKSGGNALDAAIAAALTLGVVDIHNSGLGGGCFILVRQPSGDVMAIDGRETAPSKAHRDMYLRNGQADPELSQTGPLAVAVPGALAAYDLALEKAGTRSLADLIMPAANIAKNGFAIDRILASRIQSKSALIKRFPATADILLDANRRPLRSGHRLIQKDLATTYEAIANNGIAWFYRGPFAKKVETWMSSNGGIIAAADFSDYQPLEREPTVTTYRGFTVHGFPPPSSGGIHVAQILNILENFDLRQIHSEDPSAFVHVIAEAMKLAFADRVHWLGDADFARVPRGLIDKRYAAELAAKIDLERAIDVPVHGLPPNWNEELYGRHTTHVAAADPTGMLVAITATVNTTFGSKVIVPGTGLVLNNEMDDFSAQPGKPNAFGLIGAENNAIAPGKRPLSSMSPTIITRDGVPVMTLGAAGGPKIITDVLLAIVRRIDLQMSVQDSVRSARFHHQWRPNKLYVESNLPRGIVSKLRQRGHNVSFLQSAGVLQAISIGPENRVFTAVSDPRIPGDAVAP